MSPYEAESTVGVEVRILRRQTGIGGPEHAEDEAAGPELGSRPNDPDRNATTPRRGDRLLALRPGGREGRIEHRGDPKPSNDVRGTAHVVALGMREDERREGA